MHLGASWFHLGTMLTHLGTIVVLEGAGHLAVFNSDLKSQSEYLTKSELRFS